LVVTRIIGGVETNALSNQQTIFPGRAPSYDDLIQELDGLLRGERDWLVNLANASALLKLRIAELNWAGFYLWRDGQLVLGPFQGKPACVRIGRGRGVCGTAAARHTSLVVADVHQFAGHIACDAASASEVVIPLELPDRQIGVMDLDAPIPGRFNDADRAGLEVFAQHLTIGTDWPVFIGDATIPPQP
jgi:L-methionine (R)-S-oxide reductase